MITVEYRKGDTSVIRPLPPAQWLTPAPDAAPPSTKCRTPRHDKPDTPAPDADKGTPLKVLPEGTPLKEELLTEKPKHKKPLVFEDFLAAYNEHKPKAWAPADELNGERRRNLKAFWNDSDEPLEQFVKALKFAAKDSWWSNHERSNMTFDTLFSKNNIVTFSEAYGNRKAKEKSSAKKEKFAPGDVVLLANGERDEVTSVGNPLIYLKNNFSAMPSELRRA